MSQPIPRIRLTLDHMREEIVHAFMARAGDLGDMINDEIERALRDEEIQRLIVEEVATALQDKVRQEVRGAFYGIRMSDEAMASLRREIAKGFAQGAKGEG